MAMSPKGTKSLAVLLPGWADEASALPHPAPLIVPFEVALSSALGCTFDAYASIPGALCRWHASNTDSAVPENLVCADPVHLIAGSDDAQLVPIERLNLTIEESSTFIAELNEVLGDSDSAFLHDMAGQWYYKGLNPMALDAAPTSAVEGHPMTAALPRSDEARPWRSLWSEVQMALHGSAVNQARQARGELVINSVWFWGGGALPSSAPASGPQNSSQSVLYTDNLFAQGLAAKAGVSHFPLRASDGLNLSESDHQQHIILDDSLLKGNPDFIEQRDLGSAWCERMIGMMNTASDVSAELNGLTGCREVIVPATRKGRSVLARVAQLLGR